MRRIIIPKQKVDPNDAAGLLAAICMIVWASGSDETQRDVERALASNGVKHDIEEDV